MGTSSVLKRAIAGALLALRERNRLNVDSPDSRIRRRSYPGAVAPRPSGNHLAGLVLYALFGLLGILLTVLGFKIFDWIHPNMHVEKELAEKHNIAVAIVMAAIIIGISIVIAVAIHG